MGRIFGETAMDYGGEVKLIVGTSGDILVDPYGSAAGDHGGVAIDADMEAIFSGSPVETAVNRSDRTVSVTAEPESICASRSHKHSRRDAQYNLLLHNHYS